MLIRLKKKGQSLPKSQVVFVFFIVYFISVILWWNLNYDYNDHVLDQQLELNNINKATTKKNEEDLDWCNKVTKTRVNLNPLLHISYPCQNITPREATSAIVTYLTAGVEIGKGTRTVFTGKDYINGALALGASLKQHVTRSDVHKLLLIREGFQIPKEDSEALEAVGWTLGTAPKVEVDGKYTPSFKRYKTTYTKISAIGLEEYECVLLMDADALAVGNLDDLLSCNVFDRPEYRVAGTLDYYRGRWLHFNTGSILWKTSVEEMNRVYSLTQDSSFMQRFGSDQIFLNTVYKGRTNVQKNKKILEDVEKSNRDDWGEIVPLAWDYNAQTHVEVELPDYWNKNLLNVRIIHYTWKKGWQCPEKHGSPPPLEEMPAKCEDKIPICYCREGYRWWDALKEAQEMVKSYREK